MLGVQVKRSPLPLRFKKSEWNRMSADAKRFGWHWAIAAVSTEPQASVAILDPAGGEPLGQLYAPGGQGLECILATLEPGWWLHSQLPGETSEVFPGPDGIDPLDRGGTARFFEKRAHRDQRGEHVSPVPPDQVVGLGQLPQA
jgi:hypothetical protein